MRLRARCQTKNRPRIHLSWPHNRLSKTKSLQLNTYTEAFSCLYTIFLWHERHDIREISLSTTSGSHTINHIRGTDKTIHNQPDTMFPHLIRAKSHYSLSITLAFSTYIITCKLCWCSRFIQDPGCKRAVLKGTHGRRPSKQFFTKACFKRRATAVLGRLDCSSTAAQH